MSQSVNRATELKTCDSQLATQVVKLQYYL